MASPASAAARGVAARSGGFSRTILASCALAALVAGAGYAVLARLEPREAASPLAARSAPPASGLLDPAPAPGAQVGLAPFDSVAPSRRFAAAADDAARAAADDAAMPAASARRDIAAAPPVASPPDAAPAASPAPALLPPAAAAPSPAPAAAAPGFVAPEPPRRPAEFAALAPARPPARAERETIVARVAAPPPARPSAQAMLPERVDHPERLLPVAPQAPTVVAAPVGRQASRRARNVAARTAAPEQSFFQKLFSAQPQTTGSLAYAPGAGLGEDAMRPAAATPRLRLAALGPDPGPARPAPDAVAPRGRGGRAIYDIAGQVVILPDGTRLEAHSGLGPLRDDVRYKHLRMRGVTPPHVYNLTEREALFHGVRAIRLNPVGGSGAIFGRAGLLAHTYLLGPGGDSNGCVSIRNYQAFLDAFLKGEISQLVVVPSLNGSSLLAQR